MMTQLNVTQTINANTDRTWAEISNIGGLERWFSVIADCTVIGGGEGATRILTLTDGAKIQDRIDKIDHRHKRFCYTRTESPFPVQSYQGTVDVRDVGEDCAEISWTIDIDVQEDQRDALSHFLCNTLSEGIQGLQHDLQKP